jgi:hypothetical protein
MESHSAVLSSLRASIAASLSLFESAAGLQVTFRALPKGYTHRANAVYDPLSHAAVVSLAEDWRDVDVAHEIEHLRMQLVDGFGLLAWRKPQGYPEIDAASTRIMSYVQDEVVNRRLLDLGLEFDGEVIDAALFRLYGAVAKKLRDGERPAADGMAHLDGIGRGVLCRACYFVQATLLRAQYAKLIHIDRRKRLEAFLDVFAKRRRKETRYAESVLALFADSDVHTPAGQDTILAAWAALEGIDGQVAVNHYMRTAEGRYVLPWPEKQA